MARVTLEPDGVLIELTPVEKFLALHGSLRVPYTHIANARAEDRNGWGDMWKKAIGTDAPGLKMAGTFFSARGWMFLDYGSGRNCLVLETHDETYATIVVQIDDSIDAANLAAQIVKKAAS